MAAHRTQGDAREPVAFVNGTPITKAAFDQYALMFTNPQGGLEISRESVLLSLVNQALVADFAEKRGIEVADDLVEGRMSSALHGDWRVQGLRRTGGRRAFEARVRALILFERVKEVVLGKRNEVDLEGRHSMAAAWARWLEFQRSCAALVVVDVSLQVPSHTPGSHCVSP